MSTGTNDRGAEDHAAPPKSSASTSSSSGRDAGGKGGLPRVNQAFENVASFLKGRNFPGTVRVSGSRSGSHQGQARMPSRSSNSSAKATAKADGHVPAETGEERRRQAVENQSLEVTASVNANDSAVSDAATRDAPSNSVGPTAAAAAAAAAAAEPSSRDGSGNLHHHSARDKKFERVLAEHTVNLKELGELVWSGCPVKQRPTCWKLLLGYLPPNADRREGVLARKRQEYHNWLEQHYEVDDADRSEDELAILHQIKIDVPRTAAVVDLFHKPEIQKSLARILYVRAIRNPGTSYVQGMNDLVTPFLAVFLSETFTGDMSLWDVSSLSPRELCDVEADCYWCLCKVLDSIQDHYTFAQPGIQKICFKLSELVRRIDEETCEHLNKEGIDFLQFAFRWVNCLLLREFPFSLIPRLWEPFSTDTYLAEGDSFHDFLVYVCSALLLKWSDELKKLEFQDIIMFLQHLPTSKWEHSELEIILSKAHMWRTMFGRCPSHFLR